MLGALKSVGAGERVGFTIEGNRVRQLHEGLGACFNEPDGRGETLVKTADLYLSKAQPGWDLQ